MAVEARGEVQSPDLGPLAENGVSVQGVDIVKPGPAAHDLFVDACAGAGTLGLVAALRLFPGVVLNDAWGPAAWFAGLNLAVNREALLVDR